MFKPENYRETPIILPNHMTVMVAALAKPNYFGQNPVHTFEFLVNKKIGVIYGLQADDAFTKLATERGLQYIDCSIPDFTAPNLELYDEIYEVMLQQASINKKIAIHCHGGMGRTGTILTALKLKEMAMFDDFYLRTSRDLVQHALQFLRRLPGNAYIVEVEEQEDSLLSYADKLLNNKIQIHKP